MNTEINDKLVFLSGSNFSDNVMVNYSGYQKALKTCEICQRM